MPVIAWIAIFSLLGSAGFIARAGPLLPAKEQWRCCLLPRLVSYAIGMLLGAAFLGMLPRVLEGAQGGAVLSATLLGLVVFFIPEKVRLVAARPRGGVRHSFLGGAAGPDRGCVSELCGGLCHRGSLFGLGPLATSTSLPVIAREIPQELGDFGILLEGGYARSRALVYSLLSSTIVPGALIAHFALSALRAIIAYVLAVSAASFIYMAAADLIPGLRRQTSPALGCSSLFCCWASLRSCWCGRWVGPDRRGEL